MSSNIVTISDYAINLNSGANTLIVTGNVSVTGNIASNVMLSNNILTTGIVSAVGNIIGGNLAGENLVINNISSDDSTFVSVEDGLQVKGTLLATGEIYALVGVFGNTTSNTTTGPLGISTAGNIIANGFISTSGNVIGGNILSLGLISAAGTLDVAGDATITGNLTVNGNITYINSNTVTTNEKSITLSNNQSTSANVDGSGIDIGNPTVAYWRYNNSTQSWQSNVGLTPAANATLNLGGTANYWATAYVNAISSGGVINAVGNITGGNILTAGLISATSTMTSAANITGGNILTGGVVSATSNITGGNISTAGAVQSATVSASGNITGGNVLTGGVISSTGNIQGGNVSATGNGTFGNISTAGSFGAASLSASGNVTGGNILSSTNISAVGNVSGTYLIGNGSLITSIFIAGSTGGAILSGTSNVVVANSSNVTVSVAGVSNVATWTATGQYITGALSVTGALSATGNITGNYIIGNGALLTDINATVSKINLGTSNVTVVSPDGNITVGINGTSNVIQWASTGEYITGLLDVSLTANVGNLLTNGLVSAGGNVRGGNITTGGQISATANITGGNLLTAGLISATSTITAAANITGGNILTAGVISATSTITSAANITGGNVLTAGLISATGNVTGENFFTTGNTGVLSVNSITHTGANGVGNIGDSSSYFNTVFAQATSAQYADVAEMYSTDHHYAPGTVVVFGGAQEVTISNQSHDARIAGVISTHPAHLMNSALDADHTAAVALLGRVPCQVTGAVAAGDRMVSSGIPGVAEKLDITQYQPGTIIGKALEHYNGSGVGTIEIVVGRL